MHHPLPHPSLSPSHFRVSEKFDKCLLSECRSKEVRPGKTSEPALPSWGLRSYRHAAHEFTTPRYRHQLGEAERHLRLALGLKTPAWSPGGSHARSNTARRQDTPALRPVTSVVARRLRVTLKLEIDSLMARRALQEAAGSPDTTYVSTQPQDTEQSQLSSPGQAAQPLPAAGPLHMMF